MQVLLPGIYYLHNFTIIFEQFDAAFETDGSDCRGDDCPRCRRKAKDCPCNTRIQWNIQNSILIMFHNDFRDISLFDKLLDLVNDFFSIKAVFAFTYQYGEERAWIYG